MRVKLKHLKEQYFKCKRHNGTSGEKKMTFDYYDEMEALLGHRPKSQASNKNQECGIDSGIPQSEPEMHELNENPSEKTPTKTKVPRKVGGRLSNIRKAEEFSKAFNKTQADMFDKLIEKQNKLFEESIKNQMEEQREWERAMQKEEHEHQTQQFKIMMDGFVKTFEIMQNGNFQAPPNPYFPINPTLNQSNTIHQSQIYPQTQSDSYLQTSTSTLPQQIYSFAEPEDSNYQNMYTAPLSQQMFTPPQQKYKKESTSTFLQQDAPQSTLISQEPLTMQLQLPMPYASNKSAIPRKASIPKIITITKLKKTPNL